MAWIVTDSAVGNEEQYRSLKEIAQQYEDWLKGSDDYTPEVREELARLRVGTVDNDALFRALDIVVDKVESAA